MRRRHQPNESSRRTFLRRLALGVSGVCLLGPDRLLASAPPSLADARTLSFLHTHTGETLDVVYFSRGQYLPAALARVDRLLRDFRTEEEHVIDPELLDFLHAVRVQTGSSGVLEVISGYRSPRTNAELRRQSKSVAKRSLHLQGRAIDVRLSDVDTSVMRDAARELGRGGVGYYRSSDFVHLDTGRARSW